MTILAEKPVLGSPVCGDPILADELKDLQPADASQKKYRLFKRAFDILVSFLGLIVLFVPILLVAVAIFADDPGNVFFSQERVGKNGKLFKLYKFRTMKRDTPKYMATSQINDPSIYYTRVGRFLRKLSLDELPQFLNVLKGDMSVIGPRPLIQNETEIHQARLFFGVYTVAPGITGLAQISGRDMISAAEKIRLDTKYVENYGFFSDLKIFFSTIPKVLGAKGVSEGNYAKK